MHYNLNFEFTALVFAIFIFVYSCSIYPVNSKKNYLFRLMGIVLLITLAFDVGTAFLINIAVNIPNPINVIANTMYFVFGTLLGYIFCLYFDIFIISQNGIVLLKQTKIAVLVIIEVLLFINCFTGIIFYFNEQRQYTHGPLYYVVYGGAFFFIFTVIVSLIVNIKRLTRAQIFSGVLFFVVFATPTILQMVVFPDVLLMLFGSTLGYLVNFFFLETPDYVKLKIALDELSETQEQLKQNNIQLQAEKERADYASNAKSYFLANMSHEIRTPINAILGLDTMILRESKEQGIKKYAKDIQGAGNTLLSLINDILDVSKIESGKMELVNSEYEFASMVNDVVNMIRPKIADKNLEFIINIDENIPCKLYGDDVRIKQILVNLLTNAVKYTHKGSVTLSVSAKCIDDNASLSFSVKDSGIGIKTRDIGRLSDEFVRIEETRNKNIEGTGLGMNIVISMLELMGSKIEVDSVYGEGSNFYFTITQPIRDSKPIGNINDRLMYYGSEEKYTVPFCIPDGRILVVDDNEMNRKVFANLLKRLKCTIDEADSGKKCLSLIEKVKYDIIFMDHMMPELDGVETFRIMKQMGDYLNANTPVVILTANAVSGAKEEYLAEGFDEYLSKPVDPDKLESLIGKMISEEKKQEVTDAPVPTAIEQKLEVELPFIDGVDWENAMLKLKSEALLRNSIKGFSVMAKSDLDKLKDMLDAVRDMPGEDTFAAFRIKVHSMKSNAATIGANHVAGLAKYLEYAARDEKLDDINRLMPTFEQEWMKLKESVDKEFGFGKEENNLASIHKEDLMNYLDDLASAMGDYDYDGADSVVDKLAGYAFDEAGKQIYEQMKLAVMNLDTDTCVEYVDKWKMSL